MSGSQIENLLQMIDDNVDITRREVLRYLREHQGEVVQDLATKGVASVPTSAGALQLRLEDLAAAAA
jgi:hypothetical protein